MKKKLCFTLLLICFALAGSAKKDRPSGLKNIVLRDGDMEYFMQGLVIDVPVPKNHNNDYLSIAIDNDYYDEINKKNLPQTECQTLLALLTSSVHLQRLQKIEVE